MSIKNITTVAKLVYSTSLLGTCSWRPLKASPMAAYGTRGWRRSQCITWLCWNSGQCNIGPKFTDDLM